MDSAFITNLILASVRMATPLIFLSLAELYSQRAGLVHIGLEGLAAIGSLAGFLVSLITGNPLLGVLAGAAVGILVNMIYAYATINLCAEQIVYGMAINIFAPALAAFIYRVYFGDGSSLMQITLMPGIGVPGLKDIPFIGPLLFDQTPMVYLAFALVIFTAVFFNKTKAGLNYKSVGEHPKAAATLGINVIGVKYLSCLICGGEGCSTCHHSGWVELCPCGMIHPNVLKMGGVDPEEYTGFAFGLGLTRLVMMKYGVKDIRDLNSGNLKALGQFRHE